MNSLKRNFDNGGSRRSGAGRMARAALLGLLASAAVCAGQGMVEPLYVGNAQPVVDPLARPLVGSNLKSEIAARCRVELLTTADGFIRPPSIDGAPHPLNPPLAVAGAVGGIGQNAASPDSGFFSMVFPERLPAGTKIFARVFNAPSGAEASFYADSWVATVPARGTTLALTFRDMQPLDDGDDDGDGLSNSLEALLGSNPNAVDSDGDGIPDYDEWLAGTDPANAESNLSFASAAPRSPDGPLRIAWQSVPGKRYRLQYAETLGDADAFQDLGEPILAADGEFEIELEIDLPQNELTGFFRIRLDLDEGGAQ
jgi:hypothetical protein